MTLYIIYYYNYYQYYYYYYYYYHGLNKEAWYTTQNSMLFKKSSVMHFSYLFSQKQNEKLNKIPTNMPGKTCYQTIAKTTNPPALYKFQKQFTFMSTVNYKIRTFVRS